MSARAEALDHLVRGIVDEPDAVQVTDSTLSKQVSALEAAGYVAVTKGFVGKRPRTSLKATPAGREAWAAHLATLREIAAD